MFISFFGPEAGTMLLLVSFVFIVLVLVLVGSMQIHELLKALSFQIRSV